MDDELFGNKFVAKSAVHVWSQLNLMCLGDPSMFVDPSSCCKAEWSMPYIMTFLVACPKAWPSGSPFS